MDDTELTLKSEAEINFWHTREPGQIWATVLLSGGVKVMLLVVVGSYSVNLHPVCCLEDDKSQEPMLSYHRYSQVISALEMLMV